MDDQKKSRPVSVIILVVLVFYFAIWNGLRLSQAIYFWKTLLEYGAHPLYIATSGGVWQMAGLLLVWGLWQGKTWAWLAAIVSAISYASWYWIDRLILQRPHSNWLFSMVVTLITLFFVLALLFLHSSRRFFPRDDHERKSKNTASA